MGGVGPLPGTTIVVTTGSGGIFFFRRDIGANNVNRVFNYRLRVFNTSIGCELVTIRSRFVGRTSISSRLGGCRLSYGSILGRMGGRWWGGT